MIFVVEDPVRKAERQARPHLARIALAKVTLAQLADDELEAIAEAAISILDERHDPDEDRCTASDDGCGPGFYPETGPGIYFYGEDEPEGEQAEFGFDQRLVVFPSGAVCSVD